MVTDEAAETWWVRIVGAKTPRERRRDDLNTVVERFERIV